jgi:serine/threonine protein kinase
MANKENVQLGDKCPHCHGGKIIDMGGAIMCEACFDDFTAAPVTAIGVVSEEAEDLGRPDLNASDSSSNSSKTGSRAGNSRLGSGLVGARVLGLDSARKLHGVGENRSSTSSRRGALGGIFAAVAAVPRTVDPFSLIKKKYETEARDERICNGDPENTNPARRQHPPQSLVRMNSNGSGAVLDVVSCVKCGKRYDFTGKSCKPMPLFEGTMIGNRYKIVGPIAKGGCGFIYLAEDMELSQQASPELKGAAPVKMYAVIKTQIKHSEQDTATSIAEKQMLANLRNPNIVSIFGFPEHFGIPMLVTEWLDGKTVEQLWKEENGQFSVANSMAMTIGMIQSMIPLHNNKKDGKLDPVVNPDIKLGNFMVVGEPPRIVQIDAGGWGLQSDTSFNVTSTVGYAPKEVDGLPPYEITAAEKALKATTLKQLKELLREAVVNSPKSIEATVLIDTLSLDMKNLPDAKGLLSKIGITGPEDMTAECYPTTLSDQYSLGRCAVIMSDKFDFQKKFRWSLPAKLPTFAKYPSYGDLIRRMTAEKPEDRFPTLEDVEAQAWLVLREVAIIDERETNPDAVAKPWQSDLFDGDVSGGKPAADYRLLPGLKLDANDKGRGAVETALKTSTSPKELIGMLEQVVSNFPKSREARFRLSDACIDLGDYKDADARLYELGKEEPDDWRLPFYYGRLSMAQGDTAKALLCFEALVTMLPGEPAAKLWLALACEKVGDMPKAITAANLVTLVEPQYAPAAFIQGRCLLSEGNRNGAVEALRRVPATSIAYVPAELEAARVLINVVPTPPSQEELLKAASILKQVQVDSFDWHHACAMLYEAGVTAIDNGTVKSDSKTVLIDVPLKARGLRSAASKAWLLAAHLADGDEQRDALIERSLEARPFQPFSF